MNWSYLIVAAAALVSSTASAAEIKVLSTQATEQSYRELVPQFEKAMGHRSRQSSPARSMPTSGSP